MAENLKEALSYTVELAGKKTKSFVQELGRNILMAINIAYRNLALVSTHLSLSFRHSRVLSIISNQIMT